jgi:prophage regulatory protein
MLRNTTQQKDMRQAVKEKTMNNLMTIQQVCNATSLSRTTIWRLQQRNDFPKGVRLSSSRVAYMTTDVEKWVASRPRH